MSPCLLPWLFGGSTRRPPFAGEGPPFAGGRPDSQRRMPRAVNSETINITSYPETSLLNACNSSESMRLLSATHQLIIRLTVRQTFLGRSDYEPQRRRRLVKVQNTGNPLTHRPAQGLVLGRQVDPIHRVAVPPLRPTKAWISTVESVIGHRPLVTWEDRAVCSCWTFSMRVGT